MSLPIEIIEILANPKGPDQGEEYVVLKNTGTEELSLYGLYLDDKEGESNPEDLSGYKIAPGGELIIYTDISINNREDEIRILDSFFNSIITVTIPQAPEDSRYFSNGDGTYRWEYEALKIFGTNTPNCVAITEVLPNPEESETENEWIEIKNTGTQKIDLQGLLMDDGEDGSKPYELPSITIESGEYAIVYRSESGISLNNSDDSARILTPDGKILSEVKYEKTKEGLSYQLIKIVDIVTGETEEKWEWTDATESFANKTMFRIETGIKEFDELTGTLKTSTGEIFYEFDTSSLSLNEELKKTTFEPKKTVELLYETVNGNNQVIDFKIKDNTEPAVIEIEYTEKPLYNKLLPYLTTVLAVILLAIYEKLQRSDTKKQ